MADVVASFGSLFNESFAGFESSLKSVLDRDGGSFDSWLLEYEKQLDAETAGIEPLQEVTDTQVLITFPGTSTRIEIVGSGLKLLESELAGTVRLQSISAQSSSGAYVRFSCDLFVDTKLGRIVGSLDRFEIDLPGVYVDADFSARTLISAEENNSDFTIGINSLRWDIKDPATGNLKDRVLVQGDFYLRLGERNGVEIEASGGGTITGLEFRAGDAVFKLESISADVQELLDLNNAVAGGLGDNDFNGDGVFEAQDNLAFLMKGDDTIRGGTGPDLLAGFRGNDRIDGLAGSDIVYYQGRKSDYTIAVSGSGISVVDQRGKEGRDTLVNVETLRFSDQDVKVSTLGRSVSDDTTTADTTNSANTNNTINATITSINKTLKIFDTSATNDAKVLVARVGDITRIEGNQESNTVVGTDGNDRLFGGGGHDRFYASKGSDVLDGGDGTDAVTFKGKSTDFRLEKVGGNWLVRDTRTDAAVNQGENTLTGVERVAFEDKVIALDTEGVAGKAYRIYKAGFNRDPMQGDTVGLGYWIDKMDNGMNPVEVASWFLNSNEFKTLYGTNPTNDQFLTKLYQNVLGRQPEATGYNWWLNKLNTSPESIKANVLADFAESAENQAGVINLIGNGIAYEPWVG